MSGPINNPAALTRAIALTTTQIVAWGLVCDSNGNQVDPSNSPNSGFASGWPDAYARVLGDWLGCAGSGLVTQPAGHGGVFGAAFAPAAGVGTVPAWINAYLLPETVLQGDGAISVGTGFSPATSITPIYVADGASAGIINDPRSTLISLAARATDNHVALDVNAAYVILIRYANFATGSASQSFFPGWGGNTGSGDYHLSGANQPTVTGVNGLADLEIAVPAWPAGNRPSLYVIPRTQSANDLVGPFASTSTQLVRDGVTTGVTPFGLQTQGGCGGIEAATAVMTASLTALREWLRETVKPQLRLGQTPTLVVQWMHGQNDVNDAGQASYNPATGVRTGADSNTPQGVVNNLRTYYQRLLAAWTANGYAADRLFLAVGPYHAISTNATLATYEQAIIDQVIPLYPTTCWVTRGTQMFTADLMDDLNLYRDSGGEDSEGAHLRRAGYLTLASMTVGAWKAVNPELGDSVRQDFPPGGALQAYTVTNVAAEALAITPMSIVDWLCVTVVAGGGNTSPVCVEVVGQQTSAAPAESLYFAGPNGLQPPLAAGETRPVQIDVRRVGRRYTKFAVRCWCLNAAGAATVQLQASC